MRPGRPILRYAAAWLVAGALVVAVALLVTGGGEESTSLPAVQQPDLRTAARAARCRLEIARDGAVLNPPVDGPAAVEAPKPGSYEDPLPAPAVVAAVRAGLIVIHYRPGLGKDVVEELQALQKGLPKSTIVTPNGTRMRYAVAATTFRRVLGCSAWNDEVRDAVRLFRGRYVGTRAAG